MDGNQYIDSDNALTRVRGNKVLLVRMLGLFLQNKETEALQQALAQKDLEQAAQWAHAVKGMAGNLSLSLLFDAASRLTEQCRGGEVSQELIDEFELVLANTRTAVQAAIDTDLA